MDVEERERLVGAVDGRGGGGCLMSVCMCVCVCVCVCDQEERLAGIDVSCRD